MVVAQSKARVKSWIDGLRVRLHGPTTSLRRSDQGADSRCRPVAIDSYEDYVNYLERSATEHEHRRQDMRDMLTAEKTIVTRGYCVCCREHREFLTDRDAWKVNAADMPNWREGLLCLGCGLTSRMRASIHLMQWALGPDRQLSIYLTEQVTTLHRWVKNSHPRTVGSEYLGDRTPRGCTNAQGVRHEDLTALSFADETFDALVSLEVIEHIPDFLKAFAECARVLVPGGKMILSVPFHRGPNHLLRARIGDDGVIEHLLPEEYHGNPLDPKGCLCFHHFGWDILDFLKQVGFRRAAAYSIWSRELGFVSGDCDMLQFIAEK